MSEQTVLRVRENMQLATRLEFLTTGADPDKLTKFGGILFDELDRVVLGLVSSIEGTSPEGLSEVRESAKATLLYASIDGINRHNSHLKGSGSLAEMAAVADWEATYRAQARLAHGYIEPPDFERKRKVPIQSLFVSPEVKLRGDSEAVSSTDVWRLQEAIDRTVLLGDPGGGKSTASNVLAWRSAAASTGPVPFVVILRILAADQQTSILENIEKRLAVYYQCGAPANAVEGLLLAGRAVVIFDGLDELVVTSKRRSVTERVELFCSKYPLTQVLGRPGKSGTKRLRWTR